MEIPVPFAAQTETQATQEEPAPAPAPGLFGGNFLVPMVLIVGIFYFLLIRPEKRKQQTRDRMLKALKKGDKVMTTSGIFASVVAIQDDVATLQVAEGVRVRFSRAAIQTVVEAPAETPAAAS